MRTEPETVTAYKGYKDRLYLTEKEASASFLRERLDELGRDINVHMNHHCGPCAYTPAEAIRLLSASIREYLDLTDRMLEAGPDTKLLGYL